MIGLYKKRKTMRLTKMTAKYKQSADACIERTLCPLTNSKLHQTSYRLASAVDNDDIVPG